jgi:hypothetical protein
MLGRYRSCYFATVCELVAVHRRFGGAYSLQLQGWRPQDESDAGRGLVVVSDTVRPDAVAELSLKVTQNKHSKRAKYFVSLEQVD